MPPTKWKPLLLLLVILPFWINLLIRTYALIAVFRTQGYVNLALGLTVGLGPFDMLYNNFAVIFGLVYVYMPFMVLPLYATIERLDKSFLEASLDLGASQFTTFLKVTVPLTMPGIISGIILVFIPCLGSFLTPDLLGGANAIMIGNVIERQFKAANDWPFGSALSFLLMYATFGALALRSLLRQAQQGSGRLMAAQLKPGQGPLDYGNRLWLKLLFGAIFFMLYVPIITLDRLFLQHRQARHRVARLHARQLRQGLEQRALHEALINSLVIAFIATIISTIIGALMALLLWRFRFPVKGAYEGFMALPIVIPEICMGVALLLFFIKTGMMDAVGASRPGRSTCSTSSSPMSPSVFPSSRSSCARALSASTGSSRKPRRIWAPANGRPSGTSSCPS